MRVTLIMIIITTGVAPKQFGHFSDQVNINLTHSITGGSVRLFMIRKNPIINSINRGRVGILRVLMASNSPFPE